MTKIYLCPFRRCCVTLDDNSTVMFEDRSYGEFGSIYTTASRHEQELLERSPLFGKVFKLHETIGTEEVVERKPKKTEPKAKPAAAEKTTEYPDIKRVQEAIGIIKRVCLERGLEYSVIRSREKALQRASELNISFPNLQ